MKCLAHPILYATFFRISGLQRVVTIAKKQWTLYSWIESFKGAPIGRDSYWRWVHIISYVWIRFYYEYNGIGTFELHTQICDDFAEAWSFRTAVMNLVGQRLRLTQKQVEVLSRRFFLVLQRFLLLFGLASIDHNCSYFQHWDPTFRCCCQFHHLTVSTRHQLLNVNHELSGLHRKQIEKVVSYVMPGFEMLLKFSRAT